MQQRSKMRIAIQRSGRLAEGSQCFLRKCGINVRTAKNQLISQDDVFGVELLFARDDDIPGLVESGVCDLGIIGQNLLSEYCGADENRYKALEVIMPLGFSKCRLSIASPKANSLKSISDINGKVIATSYPNILQEYLKVNNINAQIVTMHGSVEMAPLIGIADLICDLVSSGATLSENALQECMVVAQSEAILIRNSSELSAEKQNLLDRLILRINGVLNANQNKYIMLHIDRKKLPLLTQILPGKESPTIVDLQGIPDKVVVHVVSLEGIFWETIEKLKAIGASSILVLPIEKMCA